MKKLGTLFILFASVLLLGACGGDSSPSSEPSSKPGPTPTQTGKIEVPATEDTKPVFKTEGGTTTFKFTASGAWTASAVNTRADSWLTVSPTSGGAGAVTLTITTTANDTYDERSGSITIQCGSASQTIVVTQKQKDAILITSDKVEIDADGGEISVEVKANIDFTVKTDVDWISQTNTRALQTSNLSFSVAENEKSSKREGHITISSGALSEKVTVYQSGNVPTIIISKDEYEVGASGEEITVEVRSNVDVEVNIPNVNWISQVSTRSMSTNTYVFAISENESYDERKAEITFANKKNKLSEAIKVKQKAKEGVIVDTNEYTVSINGGTLDVDVKTNVVLSVSTDVDWITQANTRALHTETLHFNIAAYDGKDSRTGTITIKGDKEIQTVKVKQTGQLDELSRVREVLMEFYKATDGDNWKRNDNWGTNNPLSAWYGLSVSNGKLISINLYNNDLKGEIPENFWTLTDLEVIFLQANDLSGELSESIGNLKELRNLDLNYNELTGKIPDSLFGLTGLWSLNLAGNHFKGSIPKELGNLTELWSFEIGEYNEEGESPKYLPKSLYKLTNLTNLYVRGYHFPNNMLDEAIGSLKDLVTIELEDNGLTGSFPTSIGNLKELEVLSVFRNSLSGNIPETYSKLKKLKTLNLSNNNLSGEIPSFLGELDNLTTLSLYLNDFTGEIPQTFGNLKNLERLSLQVNKLSGDIPSSLGELTHLRSLDLFHNEITGNIPSSFKKLVNLMRLDLCLNKLSGNLPSFLGDLINLNYLRLDSNDFIGNIPESFAKLTKLDYLDLSNNHLKINITSSELSVWLDTLQYCDLRNQTPE